MNELLDMRTIIFFSSISFFIFGLFMAYFASSQKTYAGFRYWIVAAFLSSVGSFLVSLRGVIPLFFTIVLANISLAAAGLLVKKGLETFFEQKGKHFLDLTIFVIFCCVFSYFAFITPDLTVRVILISTYFGYMTLHSAYIAQTGTKQFLESSKTHLSVWMTISGLVSLLLVVLAYFETPPPMGSLMAVGFYHKLLVAVMASIYMVVYLGLIALNYVRSTHELRAAQKEVKILRGILSICSYCKKIHLEDKPKEASDSWIQMETYIDNHSEAVFSHGICPDCMKERYSHYMKQENSGRS